MSAEVPIEKSTQPPLVAEGEEEVEAAQLEENAKPEKPRRWLQDRCDGEERVMNPNSRPCCFVCYAPLVLKFFPDILEQNRVMECLGKTGVFSSKNNTARKVIMIIAFLSTIIGWSFLIFSDMAISTNYDLIEAAAYNYGSTVVSFHDGNSTQQTSVRVSLGLRAAAVAQFEFDLENGVFNNEPVGNHRVIGFDEFCNAQQTQEDGTSGTGNSLFGEGILSKIVFVHPDQCDSCSKASRAMVSSILMSSVTYFFTLTTDILRIWPNYDVNCQKVFGAFFALFSTVMGLRTFFLYRNQCYRSFQSGWTCYDFDMNIIDCGNNIFDDPPQDLFASVYISWQVSGGLIGLGVATFAKVLDLLCNFLIPTPSITRNRDEQWEYEKIAAMETNADAEEIAEAEP